MDPLSSSTTAQVLTAIQFSVLKDQLRLQQENVATIMSGALPPAASATIAGVSHHAVAPPPPSSLVDVQV